VETKPEETEAVTRWRLTQVENTIQQHLKDCRDYRQAQDRKLNWAIGFLVSLLIEGILILWRISISGS